MGDMSRRKGIDAKEGKWAVDDWHRIQREIN